MAKAKGSGKARGTPTKAAQAGHARKPTLKEIGREAQRKALLAELEANGWSLTTTARELGLTGASNVKRSILTLGLEEEYEAAKAAGKIVPGRHAGSD